MNPDTLLKSQSLSDIELALTEEESKNPEHFIPKQGNKHLIKKNQQILSQFETKHIDQSNSTGYMSKFSLKYDEEYSFDRKKKLAVRRHGHHQVIKTTAIPSISDGSKTTNYFESIVDSCSKTDELMVDLNQQMKSPHLLHGCQCRPLKLLETRYKSERKGVQKNPKPRHRNVKISKSWSPDCKLNSDQFKDQESISCSKGNSFHKESRSIESDVVYSKKFSRNTRIRKWLNGKLTKSNMEFRSSQEDAHNANSTSSTTKDSQNLSESSHHKLQSNCNHCKVSKNEVENLPTYKRSGILQHQDSISSESNVEFATIEDIHRDLYNIEFHGFIHERINSLKDKLHSKGHSSKFLDNLESKDIGDVKEILSKSISRVQLDVFLLWSCIQNNLKFAKLLLKNGANPNARDTDGFSALHLASDSGSHEIVKLLLHQNVQVNSVASWDNKKTMTPLMLSARNGYVNIVELLINHRMDVNLGLVNKIKTALHYAVISGNVDCVKVLIEAGATINPLQLYSETPLHIAVQEGYLDIVKILLKSGADVHAVRDENKTNCLHMSTKSCHFEITELLLKAGAHANQADSFGKTPLHQASKSQCSDVVQLLLNFKADPNAIENTGRTALHTGIFKGSRNFECLKLLLEHGADVNVSDNAGYTPLHLAALNDLTFCVKLLLKNGADLTKMTKGGITALNIIGRRTPSVLTEIQGSLNNSISFVEQDNNFEHEGQTQLDFRVLMSSTKGGPECHLLSCFIEEGQKNLLKHPLCETFLYLKWLRVRSFFVANVIFYALYVICLTQYFYMIFTGTSEYHHDKPRNTYENFLNHMQLHSSNNNSLFENTSFPLNNSDLYLQWLQSHFMENCLSLSPHYLKIRTGLLYTIWYILSLLMVKETFQALDSPKFYLSSFDNILVWPIICGSFTVTIYSNITQSVCPWEFHTAALVILLCWMQLLILIGRFPTFGLYIHMFVQVTKNFGKFLFAYICLINAFSFSFGILFHNQPPFRHRLVRLLKTLVMMTGEIDYNEWFYESKPGERILYKGTSHFVFAIFLLFVTIILMNLLVGLAVSDIQGLQKSAGLDRLVRQTQLIAHFELFMFSRWLKILIPQKILQILHNRILLLNSAYGNIFILNSKLSSNQSLPSDITENIKCIARSRDHLSRRRNLFSEYRALSNGITPRSCMDGDISKNVETIRCGLDMIVWEMEDMRKEMILLKENVSNMRTEIKSYADECLGEND